MKKFLWVLLALVVLAGCQTAPEQAEEPEAAAEPEMQMVMAVAELSPTEGSQVSGSVTFHQTENGVHVEATVSGLEPGKHGFHVHENGDCSAPDATSAGGHFNPEGVDHGGPDSSTHHVGDLGNIEAGEDGTATYNAQRDFLSLEEGTDNSIIGKAVIVHSGEDDLTSQPTGAAGSRLACGVIERQ